MVQAETPPHLFTIADVKEWRTRQAENGLRSTLNDFFQFNNYCRACHGRKLINIAQSGPFVWDTCPECQGTGRYQETSPELKAQIEKLRTALSEIGGAAAEALLENNIQDWGDGGSLGDTLIGIKDIVETAFQAD